MEIQKALDAAAQNFFNLTSGGNFPCSACAHEGPHESNGERGYLAAWCCTACGEHMDTAELFDALMFSE